MSLKRRMRRAAGNAPPVPKRVDGYEVTFSPIFEPAYAALGREVHQAVARFHDTSRSSPQEAIPELLKWIERYPQVHQFSNYLAVAYTHLGESERAVAVVEEHYRRSPEYLFARVNHAENCLYRDDLDGAREALGPALDLRALYPHRKRFHVSEFAGFTYAVGLYHLKAGDRAAAERAYERLRAVAPDNPGTSALHARLYAPAGYSAVLRLRNR